MYFAEESCEYLTTSGSSISCLADEGKRTSEVVVGFLDLSRAWLFTVVAVSPTLRVACAVPGGGGVLRHYNTAPPGSFLGGGYGIAAPKRHKAVFGGEGVGNGTAALLRHRAVVGSVG